MTPSAVLEKAGLDQAEVSTYLALVSLGEATAGVLARKSGVARTQTYPVLESLVDKGLVQISSEVGVRRYQTTDFGAVERYIDRQQLTLYKAQQEAQQLSAHLEHLARPQVPLILSEPLQDQVGEEELWKLLHSTITREIWVINAPSWWGNEEASAKVKKWEQYRLKQHLWEKRFSVSEVDKEAPYTQCYQLAASEQQATIFLIDQYQVQVSSWFPFRAVRLESQEMVEVMKNTLDSFCLQAVN